MRIRVSRIVHSASWGHAVEEIGLIVLGILIALAANSWWQDREDRHTELEALREMRAGLVLDLADLQADLDAYRKVESGSRLLLDHFQRGAPYTPALDSIFSFELIFRIHLSNSSPYESLRSRGLGLISDDSLRLEVIDYYGLRNSNIAIWNTSDTRLVDEAVRPYFRGRFVIGRVPGTNRRSATPTDYPALARDPYFRGLLMDRLEFMRLTIPEYETTIREARRLIGMIDRQVERLE
jgi:hypothetical protein